MLDVATAQLTYAGLIEQFEAVYSADEVQALKPASAPYRMVAQRCAVEIGDLCLIAAHAWDVSGALAAGCQAAFVGRAGGVASPLGKQPAVSGGDLTEVADAVLQRFPDSRAPPTSQAVLNTEVRPAEPDDAGSGGKEKLRRRARARSCQPHRGGPPAGEHTGHLPSGRGRDAIDPAGGGRSIAGPLAGDALDEPVHAQPRERLS